MKKCPDFAHAEAGMLGHLYQSKLLYDRGVFPFEVEVVLRIRETNQPVKFPPDAEIIFEYLNDLAQQRTHLIKFLDIGTKASNLR